MATLQELIESEIADFFAGFDSPGEPESVEDMQSQLLARIAPLIASMGQEPVAYIDPFTFKNFATYRAGETDNKRMGREWVWANPDAGLIPLYAAPQLPQPAVPDENGLLPCPFCGSPAEHYPDGDMEGYSVMCGHKNGDCDSWIFGFATPEEAERSWNTRAAMLQGAEPVRLSAGDEHVRREYRVEGSPWIQCSKDAYDRRKSAGYEVRELYERPQNSPQNIPGNIPDGWVAVPVDATLDMVKAGAKAASDGFLIPGIYRSILASAPDFREISNSSTKHFRENAETSTKCWCHTCRPVTMTDMRFIVCPECGNKRCPHANDHRNACTGSNEPGQEGSAYPAAPQQEVK